MIFVCAILKNILILIFNYRFLFLHPFTVWYYLLIFSKLVTLLSHDFNLWSNQRASWKWFIFLSVFNNWKVRAKAEDFALNVWFKFYKALSHLTGIVTDVWLGIKFLIRLCTPACVSCTFFIQQMHSLSGKVPSTHLKVFVQNLEQTQTDEGDG